MTRIIAAIDQSSQQQHVVDAAVWAAQKRREGIVFVHVIEKKPMKKNDHAEALPAQTSYKHGLVLLKNAAEAALDAGVDDIDMQQRHDDLLKVLQGMEREASIVVIGRSGQRSGSAERIGSHVESITRGVKHPVLLTSGAFTPPKKVMVAYDGQETASTLVRKIAEGSLLRNLEIHLVMIGEDKAANQASLMQAAEILDDTTDTVTTALIPGEPASAIKDYIAQHHMDMLVMGAFARSGVRHLFLGSKTLKMIAGSSVPLLIMR